MPDDAIAILRYVMMIAEASVMRDTRIERRAVKARWRYDVTLMAAPTMAR